MPRSRPLVVLVAVVLLACGSEPDPPTPEKPRATELEVTAMSFNVRWDGFDDGANGWTHRRALAADVIRRHRPDVVGLQESSEAQVADLLAALPDYRAFHSGERSLVVTILYRADRFRPESSGAFWLVETSELSGGTRACTWVQLVEKTTGLAFRHLNFHLDHRSLPSREESVVALTRHLAERDPPDPFVVTGDFNTAEKSPPMRYLLAAQPLKRADGNPIPNPVPMTDTFRALHPDATDVGTGTGFGGKRDGPKIDHVLVEPSARVLEARIVRDHEDGRYPSDHYPVLARVVFGESP